MQSLLIVFLTFAMPAVLIAFLLGWIWPLTAGIVKTRRGNRSVGLIIFGGIWGSAAVLATALIGFGIYTALSYADSYNVTTAFNPAEYEGDTASIVVPYKGESKLTASSSHDNARYRFSSTDGTFIVPAAIIKPDSYSISAKNEKNKVWTANWSLQAHTASGALNLETNSSLDLTVGPPLVVTATRKELAGEKQNINITVTDSSGNRVSLSAQPAPSIEILDKDENVVWTHKLSYG